MSEQWKEDPITYTTTSFTKQVLGTDAPEIGEIIAKKAGIAKTAIKEATIGKIEKIGAGISSAIYDAATGRRRTKVFVETEKSSSKKLADGKITYHSTTMTERLLAKMARMKTKFGKTTRIVAEDREMIDFIKKLREEDN